MLSKADARRARLIAIHDDTKQFHIALIRSELSQKDFCDLHGINHNIFSQAVNGHRTFPPVYLETLREFVNADLKEQEAEWEKYFVKNRKKCLRKQNV